MSVQKEVDQFVARPWSRTIVADEDGVFLAAIPELEGCFADGDTPDEALARLDAVLREWLEMALENGEAIPDPRRIDATDEYSGRFSVRVPKSLHRKLTERAEEEASSLNQLVVSLLAAGLEKRSESGTEATPTKNVPLLDIDEVTVARAVGQDQRAIGALKRLASRLRHVDLNLACLLYAFAAERAALVEGVEDASRELGTTAALARREKRRWIAEALWNESLRHDPTNLRSLSALGQLLHHQGRYAEAIECLEPASAYDNHALLFLGWALLNEGENASSPEERVRGLGSIERALKNWAFQNHTPVDRHGWLRHLVRLAPYGPDARELVEGLVRFANANSAWATIELDDVWNSTLNGDEAEEDPHVA